MINDFEKRFQISLIISIAIFILIFYFFPKFDRATKPEYYYSKPDIIIQYIPATVQQKNAFPPPPEKPAIPVEGEDSDILSDVEIETVDRIAVQKDEYYIGKNLHYQPRQILDVLPQKPRPDIEGEIILLLKIGKDGKMKNYKLITNTTGSEKVLHNALEAAQKSIWEVVLVKDRTVEYWIEKKYKFSAKSR